MILIIKDVESRPTITCCPSVVPLMLLKVVCIQSEFFRACVCIKMSQYFTTEDKVIRLYRRFKPENRRLSVTMTAPTTSAGEQTPARYFADRLGELVEYSLRDLDPSDMVGIIDPQRYQ